ncbi:SDR family oxidoreductase [Nocardia sp. NPDC050193]
MTRMSGKVALITRAGRQPGRACALRLAEEGADIVAMDIPGRESEAGLAETAALVREFGRRTVTGSADPGDFDAVAAEVHAGAADLGPLDTIVAITEFPGSGAPSWEIDDEIWDRTLDMTVTGAWHIVKAGLAALSKAGGSVTLLSSTAAIRSLPAASHRSAAEHAVTGLARTLANELVPQRIRVNTVHPSPHDTAALLPVCVEPTDVANAILFLASEESRCITGLQMIVDAGLTQKVA